MFLVQGSGSGTAALINFTLTRIFLILARDTDRYGYGPLYMENTLQLALCRGDKSIECFMPFLAAWKMMEALLRW